jgi:membrane protein DedA with SNARE-associated domain/rhodanese-related sulfurtransferase
VCAADAENAAGSSAQGDSESPLIAAFYDAWLRDRCRVLAALYSGHNPRMEALLHFIEVYGLWVVFVSVLLDQGGLPIPAYPPIIATTALAYERGESLAVILIIAILAAVSADLIWFACGRRFGSAMLRLMCKISMSPDTCVAATRKVYSTWGAKSLIFAKYVPGLAAIATTLAGESRVHLVRFIIYDSIGATLWVAGAVALGAIFHDAVADVLLTLEQLGSEALLLLVLAIAIYVAIKWRKRQRFLVQIRMAKLTPDELEALMLAQADLKILDVRSAQRRAMTGWIPGSIHASDIDGLKLDATSEVVVYCECPNDASAAVAALRLRQKGFVKVRPLAGGIDAWSKGGRKLERSEASAKSRL